MTTQIERLGEPLVTALLRLTPSAAVAAIGPAGSLTEVRIRGAEANHTLLFVDGIKHQRPGVRRHAAVRAAQRRSCVADRGGARSAIGVVGLRCDRRRDRGQRRSTITRAHRASAEARLVRLAPRQRRAAAMASSGKPQPVPSAGSARAGSTASARRRRQGRLSQPFGAAARDASVRPSIRARRLGVRARPGAAEFDGYDLVTFVHADTLDSSRNRLGAGRAVGRSSAARPSAWSGQVGATLLGSSNRNFLDGEPINRTRGTRRTVDAPGRARFATGAIEPSA